MHWFVYIVRCSDGSYYTGYTNNVEKRLVAHNSGNGAKYTRSRLPCELVYTAMFASRGMAMQREYQIKRLSRAEKQVLIDADSKKMEC